MRTFVIALVSIFVIVAAIVALSEPGRPLYTLGNVRKSGYLTAFGFVRELPKEFLQPADQLLRIFPGKDADPSKLKELLEKEPGLLYIEYMPDKTYIQMHRAPKLTDPAYRPISPAEWALISLRNCGHLMPNVPIRYCDTTEEPKCSKKTISGCKYDGAEAAMAIDGGAVEKEKIKESDKFEGLALVRDFADGKQRLTVIVITPGHEVNLKATEKLLDCLSLK